MKYSRLIPFSLFLFPFVSAHAETKVGIIGCDTSHTLAFTKTLNVAKPDFAAGFRVTCAHKWGSKDIVSSTNRYEKYIAQLMDMGVEMCETVDDLLAKVDVVCLETNDGREHLWQAEKCFKAKKRVFIDKPIAQDYPHAKAIYDLGKKYKAEYFSSSTLRYASANAAARACGTNFASCVFYAPCPLEAQGTHSRYVWYGIHAFETVMTVMRGGAASVRAYSAGSCDFATITWTDGRIANLKLDRTPWGYGGWAFPGDAEPLPLCGPEGYEPLLKGTILPFFKTGVVPVPHEETLEIFAIMDAAAKSQAEGGREVAVSEIINATNEAVPVPVSVRNGVPSDADVLYDGTSLAKWRNMNGGPAGWHIQKDGSLLVDKTGNLPDKVVASIYTRDVYTNFQMHVEYRIPEDIELSDQWRGNSGVKIFGCYEVQILDSYENASAPKKMCGAIYSNCPPLVNAAQKPGVWQTYDIVFHAPRAANGQVLERAKVTVLHNGVLVQDGSMPPPYPDNEVTRVRTCGDIELQSHNDASKCISFRNIWIRRLAE